MKPGWGNIDAARVGDTVESLKDVLVGPTSRALLELQAMLTGGLTFTDNIKCAIIKRDLVHGVEQPVTLGFRPIGMYALRSEAVGANVRYAVESLDWRMDAPGGTIGVTARYDQSATGYVGEAVRSFLPFASRNALVNAIPETIASISLTAGDWDLSCICGFGGAALTGTALYASLSPTNNTLSTDYGDNIWDTGLMPTANASSYIVIPSYRVSLSASATYYMVAQANFTAGSTGAFGRISATRARKLDNAVTNTVTLLCVGG